MTVAKLVGALFNISSGWLISVAKNANGTCSELADQSSLVFLRASWCLLVSRPLFLSPPLCISSCLLSFVVCLPPLFSISPSLALSPALPSWSLPVLLSSVFLSLSLSVCLSLSRSLAVLRRLFLSRLPTPLLSFCVRYCGWIEMERRVATCCCVYA